MINKTILQQESTLFILSVRKQKKSATFDRNLSIVKFGIIGNPPLYFD